MKYRIKHIVFREQKMKKGSIKAHRKENLSLCVLPPTICEHGENINFNTLFELGELPSPRQKKKRRKPSLRLKSFFVTVGAFIFKIITFPFRRVRDRNRRLAFYSGLLCSSVLVALFSLVAVLAALFGGYLAPYEELTVPYVVGEELDAVETAVAEEYELLISYKNSDSVPAGVIISQTPDGGVTRKLYKNRYQQKHT